MRAFSKQMLVAGTVLALLTGQATALAQSETDAAPNCPAEQESQPSLWDKLDAGFGQYVVTPVFTVMFVDVLFWDNHLPKSSAAKDEIITVTGKDTDNGEAISFPARVLEWDGEHFQVTRRTDVLADKVTVTPDEPTEDEGVDEGADEGEATEATDEEGMDAAADTESASESAPAPPKVGDEVTYDGKTWKVAEISKSLDMRGPRETIEVEGGIDIPGCFPVGSMQPQGEVVGDVDGGYVVRPVSRAPEKRVTRAQTSKDFEPKVGAKANYQGMRQEIVGIDDMLTLEATQPTVLADTSSIVYDRPANPKNQNLPLVVLWLVLGAIFFTFRMMFINLRAFGHAIAVTAGRYDDPDDPGEVNHFKALSSALSATVGLGNIAGVALAVAAGGPGAVFWMIVAGFLGMSSKFVECTLGQLYRHIDENGVVSGGPMRYLAAGLSEKGWGGLGRVLAVVFAVMCIGGSFGGGNMFQANQAYAQLSQNIPTFPSWLFGLMLATCVAMVIIGGIKRIGNAAGMIVPVMCGVYLLAGIGVLIVNAPEIPTAFSTIFREAFTLKAGIGGLIGVIVTGFRRAAFSNEAGVGSAAIAHSAASTKEPVREGIVASLGPFIDTIIVCTMTGLVVVVTRAYLQDVGNGVTMTSAAFESVFGWFPYVLTFAVIMFAFSTMISWSYYGERCWAYLFGHGSSMVYRVLFVIAAFLGSVFQLGSVLDFSDLMVLGMAFPNILGVVLLSGVVKKRLDEYWGRFKSGEMPTLAEKTAQKAAAD